MENDIDFCNILWLRSSILYLAPLNEEVFKIDKLEQSSIEDRYKIKQTI